MKSSLALALGAGAVLAASSARVSAAHVGPMDVYDPLRAGRLPTYEGPPLDEKTEERNRRIRALNPAQGWYCAVALQNGVETDKAIEMAENLDPELTVEDLKAAAERQQEEARAAAWDRFKIEQAADAARMEAAAEKRRRKALKRAGGF